MAKGKYRIRQAGYADLEAMANVKARIWQEAYAGLLSDSALIAQSEPDRLARSVEVWAESLHEGAYLWLVTDIDQRVVGMAHACLARDSDPPQFLELAMINLLAEAQGAGVADHLLTTAIGDAPAYLWVLKGNDRAVAFYRRHGFVADGTTKSLATLGGAVEVRMVRS